MFAPKHTRDLLSSTTAGNDLKPLGQNQRMPSRTQINRCMYHEGRQDRSDHFEAQLKTNVMRQLRQQEVSIAYICLANEFAGTWLHPGCKPLARHAFGRHKKEPSLIGSQIIVGINQGGSPSGILCWESNLLEGSCSRPSCWELPREPW